jgi:hypothetical protein
VSRRMDDNFLPPNQIRENKDKITLGQQDRIDQTLPKSILSLRNPHQSDYVNSHIAYLFFSLQKQVDRYLIEETKLLKLEQEIAKSSCPYKLGSTVWVIHSKQRYLHLVSSIRYTLYAPHYEVKFRKILSTTTYEVGNEYVVPLSKVTLANPSPIPEPFFSKLLSTNKIDPSLNKTVGDYRRERELGEQLLATCPAGVDPIAWVNKIIRMPRTYGSKLT